MALSFDTVTIQPVAKPAAATVPRQPFVRPIGERDSTSNDRRADARSNPRDRVSVAFRSFLAAATLAGITETLSDVRPDAVVDEIAPARETRVPDRKKDPTVIDADEAEGLYRSAHAADEAKEAPRSTRAREFHAAATRYAKSYFAVEGTFARPGESLEISA